MGISSTNSALLIALDRAGGVPLHRQIEAALRGSIRSGRFAAGSALPASRVLAADLGVSRGVVVEAYQQLSAEGYLVGRAGGRTEVAAGIAPVPAAAALPAPPAAIPRYDLSYGRADVAHFPRAAWMRALRSALTDAPNDAFGYPAGPGMPQLREALAEYLNRVRGTSTEAANIIVCTGYAQGVALAIQTLGGLAARGGWPSRTRPRAMTRCPSPALAGLEVVAVPVDEDGIRVDALQASDADAVILTPAHQWPTGAVLSAAKRAAVIAWAQARDAVIIEDDYDAEYRYDGSPVGAMQGLAPDRVVYGGSASKTLAPGIRLGWLAAPAAPGESPGQGEDRRRPRVPRTRAAGAR